MRPQSRGGQFVRPSLSFALLIGFLGVVWIAGGGTRADILGQAFVRAAAWAILVAYALVGPRPILRDARPVWFLLLATVLLVLIQLVPLPPALWQALPGRDLIRAAAGGDEQPWRPWSMVPSATANAASALVVPFTTLLLFAGLSKRERDSLPAILLILIVGSMLVGLLQFSGAGFGNPLINDTPGQVSGSFANRNHFALFLAIGCLLAPVWAFADVKGARWRGPVALGVVPLLMLMILASGSRGGMVTGSVALVLGLVFAWHPLRRELHHAPRWLLPALVVGVVAAGVGLIVVSVAADRASSISRVIAAESGEDMRTRALPTVLAMINRYFPIGSGFGGFDPLFRIQEPFTLLKPTYFNHAHNDYAEIALDGGLPAILLLMVALGWWGWASVHAWRAPWNEDHRLPRLGSATIALVLIGSALDYPARTPMLMAIIVIAAAWLASVRKVSRRIALPAEDQHL